MRRCFALTTRLSTIVLILASIHVGLAGELEQRLRRERPIEMGVSGGNVRNRSFTGCCSGTLGGLLSTPDGLAILSNNHILGRNIDGTIGEDVNQPGLIERSCGIIDDDIVAQVSGVMPMDFSGGDNVMDAAIALAMPGMVREDGFILEIGSPSSVPIEPAIGMPVKKSGRTTGLTFGTIASINLTTNVSYQRPCGDVNGLARFVNQIRITPGSFIAGGDSGSIVVENTDTCPGIVGLVFAGSPSNAVANPIAPILDAFNAQPVGCPAAEAATVSKYDLTARHPEVKAVIDVQTKYQSILDIPGVVGTGVGLYEGKPVLEIYLEDATSDLDRILPTNLDGVEVKPIETGRFEAL